MTGVKHLANMKNDRRLSKIIHDANFRTQINMCNNNALTGN
jgi:hypothetical protein